MCDDVDDTRQKTKNKKSINLFNIYSINNMVCTLHSTRSFAFQTVARLLEN